MGDMCIQAVGRKNWEKRKIARPARRRRDNTKMYLHEKEWEQGLD
jgi:hypothetical protein